MLKRKVSLIVIAMPEEFDYFLKGLDVPYTIEKDGEDELYFFEKNNQTFLAVRGKVGKSSTSFYIGKLSMLFDIERIFNIGTSGGYSQDLKIGDVVVATKVSYHDVDAVGFGYKLGQVPGFPLDYDCDMEYLKNKNIIKPNDFKIYYGLITSGDSFITKKNVSSFPISERNSLCVEMEAGAVGQCAYQLKVPFIVIRSISDNVLAGDNEKDSVFNLDGCCANCVKVLLSII